MPIIDTEIPLKRRNLQRLIALPIILVLSVCIAIWILPSSDRFFRYASLEGFGFRAFFAHAILLQCVWYLLFEIVITIRSRNSTGSWKIYLDRNIFRWESPKHYWGKETDFNLKISQIIKIERYIYTGRHDKFWVYPDNGKRIRIKNYCGLSLPWVFQELQNLNIEYVEEDFTDIS